MLGIINFTDLFSVPILVLIDVFALTLTSSPLIYFWVIKPYIVQRDDAEKAHLEAKHQAEEADRAKSEFLAKMSHEIRTPLNAILGFSELIRDQMLGPVGTAQYVEYARDIHASGAHLLSLVNDILDLSKIEAGKFELHEEVFEVREIVNQAIDLVALMSSEKGLALTTDLARGLPLLYADRRAVRQMLINLLSNAIKFAPEGSSVAVRASAATHGLTVAVADTGIGIDPKDMEKVLSPFGQVVVRTSR
jgi:signal transduction histidine kinase